jgi:4-amino-4-deoxy-L-arabinose transferase-like glycosyltransferase
MTVRLPTNERDLFRLAAIIVMAITVVRIAVLVVSPLELYPDEAQYWWWAQTPDWGYFSKPPMIAWIVRAVTAAFGDAEWAIRLASPLLHMATALLLYGIGRLAYDAGIGFWSAIAYVTLPGVAYSSGLISTDVPLLFCWALALYAFLRSLEEPGWRWPLVCGAALGLGLLSKYAMLYFALGAILAALAVPKVRRLVFSLRGAAVLAIGLLLLSPNLMWNAAHHYPTVAHTAANADWRHAHYSLGNALQFVGGQFGVFGPLMMLGLALALWRMTRSRPRRDSDLVLAAFTVPVLVLILIQSFISEANANWAAAAYIAAVPLAVAALLEWRRGLLLWTSLGLHAVAMLALWMIAVSPSTADAMGQGNAFKRQQGWRTIGGVVAAEARGLPYDAIAARNRSLLAELLYYARPRTIPIRAWDRDTTPHDHFQMSMPLTPASHRVLLVLMPDEAPPILATFESHRRVRVITIPVGGHRMRTVELYDAQDFHRPLSTR